MKRRKSPAAREALSTELNSTGTNDQLNDTRSTVVEASATALRVGWSR